MRYQLRDREPADLKTAQELAEKIEKNMQSSGKSNIPGYTRGNTSYNKESKGKVVESKDKETSKDPMKEMAKMMKTLVTNQNQQMANHVAQLNHIQNRLVMMERNHVSHAPRNFQPKPNQMYQKKTQEPRIPNQLDSVNLVEDAIPFCWPCS